MIFYPLELLLQIFCVYHAYKHNSEQKWYWLIIFFPVFGSAIYLYHHFYNRETVATLSEGIKGVVNKNYHTEKLENKLNFSDSVLNKTNLANKYMEIGDYSSAIQLYESCLNGFDKENIDSTQKLIKCYYALNNYEKAVLWGSQVKNEREFQSSDGHVAYAWSLFHLNKTKEAEENFVQMDASYCNYFQRIEYAKFLYQTSRTEDAQNKLQELTDEYKQMGAYQLKHYRGLKRAIDETMVETNKPL